MKARRLNTPVSFPLSTLFKKSVLFSAIACSIGLAQAQDVDKSKVITTKKNVEQIATKEKMEVIEVRGIRASAAANLAIKRLSNSTVEAITAEDIGKFPDKNIADSLQRVPGVVIQRSGGEGSTVSIRGLSSDLTFTQLNGNFIASSPGRPSRSFSYSLLPSTMIEMVEIYKSSEARLDEGGIGGTVLLHTRKPLNMEKNSGVLNIESTYADITDKHEPQFSGIYSWKNDAEDFGLLLGFTQQDRTNRSQTSRINIINKNFYYQERVDNQAVENGAYGYAPQSMVQDVREEKRNRQGIQVTSQWRVNDNLEFAFNYFGFTLGQDAILNQLEYPEWHNNDNHWTDVRVDADSEWVTGIDYSAATGGEKLPLDIPRMNGEYIVEESTSDTFDFSAVYEGENFEAKFVIGHTEGEGGPSLKYRSAYYPKEAVQYYGFDLSGRKMTTYMDPEYLNNLRAGIGGAADVHATDSSFITGTQEEDYVQLDVSYMLDMGIVETLHFGAKYRDGKIHRDSRNTFYLSPDFDIAAAEAGNGISLDDDYSRNGGIPGLLDVLADEPLDNLSDVINTNLYPAVDWQKYHELLENNLVRYTRKEPNFVYEVQEEILSAYIQADYRYNDLRGNFGLRFVDSTTTSSATDKIVYELDYKDAAGNTLPEELRRIEEFVLVNKETNDTHILPSFNIVWEIDDNWILRGAAAKVMSRPDYQDLGNFQTLTYNSSEYAADFKLWETAYDEIDDSEGWVGSGGNSSLKALESTQFDLSLEYYYGEGSGASIAVFKKDVDNFVVPLILDVKRSLPTRDFTVTTADNLMVTAGGDDLTVRNFRTNANGTNAESTGVEVSWQHFFDNGFGFYANYTYNDTNQANVELDGTKIGESPLIGSSEYQANLSAFYEDDLFSVRASYNVRGPSVGSYVSSWETNFYTDEYEQIDVNASYNFTDSIILSASIVNLTQSETYVHLGNDTKNRFISNSYGGRRIYAGITYRF
ncbi:MAG: TonB-dependent receptor [Colwellia sp.]|nr:TonB-dependent receptor [Colwellia sp.]